MKYWWCIPIALSILFIWDNSLQNGVMSDGFSMVVTKWLAPVLHKMGAGNDLWELNRVVRKLAHVLEFALLGAVMYVLLRRYGLESPAGKTVGIGMLVASSDEVLQLFSDGRSSQLSDVMIDSLGIVLGIMTVKAVIWIISLGRNRT